MYKVYYNSNCNLPKEINNIIVNHKGHRDELLLCDNVTFEELGKAVSFIRECSSPITKEYELTDVGFDYLTDVEEELLLNREEFVSLDKIHI